MDYLNNNRMEDRSYPEEVVGTKYRVIEARPAVGRCPAIPEGSIVTLHRNGRSSSPFFQLAYGTTTDLFWRRLERIEGPR